ncbi:phosphotransferase enzyme family protein [Penicillium verhagenii]|nr:phosphotransferase enzyme family protein [Penicillium verhagenii]
MDFDSRAKQQSDRVFQTWIQNLLKNAPENLAGKLASRHCRDTPVSASRLHNGAFNVCYRVTFENGARVVVRFAALGRVIARIEKVEGETALMEFISQRTTIPVPKIWGFGKCAIGPYIVMSFIEGSPPSGLGFSIGAIRRDELGTWTVPKRPFTFNMNRLAQFSNIPLNVFKRQHFKNAADYFEELAEQHFHHLEFQLNDAVISESDCRQKHIARCLFRKICREIATEHLNGPFRLYCDDLCSDNILVEASGYCATGVIDWEFTYPAPVEFAYAAPWWLLLERPEDWEDDLDQLLSRFRPKSDIFLEVLRDCEASKIKDGTLLESQRLSSGMGSSLETGQFWICLASRHSAMFGEIYWKFIDPKFFGRFTTIEDRLDLLSADERLKIDTFIEMKLRQESERKLASHYSVDELVDL